jgi:hypothetical protein
MRKCLFCRIISLNIAHSGRETSQKRTENLPLEGSLPLKAVKLIEIRMYKKFTHFWVSFLQSIIFNIHTVDSPQIGHAPDPDKPVTLRTCPVSRPQCKFNSELRIGQLSDSRTKIPAYRTICSFAGNPYFSRNQGH